MAVIRNKAGTLLIIFTLLTQCVFGQSNPLDRFTYDILTEDLRDIKENGLKFYQNQVQKHGIEEVSIEGSPYLQFMNFIDEWETKLAPYEYDLYAYFNSQSRESETRESDRATCDWEELGPIVPTNGDYTRYHGMGMVEFIRIADHNPDLMLSGSIFGGLFFSSDAGQTWQAVSDNWAIGGCAWAEFSEQYPGVIVAAQSIGQKNLTGRADFTTIDGGIMISYNYGQTWRKLISTNIISPWASINKVVFDPSLPESIYIGMTNGLFRYENIFNLDDPNLWSPIEDFNLPGVFTSTNCLDIEVVQNQTLFPDGPFIAVTVGGFKPGVSNSHHNRAFISHNNGNTFSEVFTQLGTKSDGNFETSTYALSVSNPFIHFCTQIGSIKQIWTLNLTNSSENHLKSITDPSNFGNTFAFAVNPSSSETMVFSQSTGLYGTLSLFSNPSNEMSRNGLHDDIEHFVWHPNNPQELWVCTHGGVERSVDHGQTWTDMSYGLGTANVNSFDGVSSDPSKMILALEHSGSVRLNNSYYLSSGLHDWQYFGGGDAVGATIIEEGDLNFYFSSSQSAFGTRYATSYGPLSNGLGFSNTYAFNAWFEKSTDRKSIYTPGPGTASSNIDVYRSDLVPNTLPTRYAISDFENTPGFNNSTYNIRRTYASAREKNMLFASGTVENGNSSDNVLLFTDIADDSDNQNIKNSWAEIQMPYDNGISINPVGFNGVVGSHYIDGRYYILTAGTQVFATAPNKANAVYVLIFNAQGGYTLTDITGNLPNSIVGGKHDNAIMLEKGTNEGIYVILSSGVYYLHGDDLNSGNFDWIELGEGLPNIQKNGIKGNYEINKLRVGTFGRGMWEGCFVCPEREFYNLSGAHSSYSFWEVTDYIESVATIPAGNIAKYRAGNEIMLKPGFNARKRSDFHAFIHSCLPNGANSFRSSEEDPWENLNIPEINNENIEAKPKRGELIGIYPNPSENQFNIQLNDLGSASVANIKIVDMEGKLIRQWQSTFNDENVVISDLQSGMYFLTITIGEETQTLKFMKK